PASVRVSEGLPKLRLGVQAVPRHGTTPTAGRTGGGLVVTPRLFLIGCRSERPLQPTSASRQITDHNVAPGPRSLVTPTPGCATGKTKKNFGRSKAALVVQPRVSFVLGNAWFAPDMPAVDAGVDGQRLAVFIERKAFSIG